MKLSFDLRSPVTIAISVIIVVIPFWYLMTHGFQSNTSQFVEIKNIGDGKYIQCIDGVQVLMTSSGFLNNGATEIMLDYNGLPKKCSFNKVYSYQEVKLLTGSGMIFVKLR